MDFAKDMQAVVLLGGLGTRLKELTVNTPKPMVQIHGKPFFYYQLELMKWYGFRKFLFCVGYKGSIVEEHFKDGKDFGVEIRYSYDGDKLLGTGGALRKALSYLEKDFLLIYGDSYMDVDYNEIIYHYMKLKSSEGKKGLMTVFKNHNALDKSNVIFKDNKLICYNKKNTVPEMEYIDYGISVLNRSIIETIPDDEVVDLADIYTGLVTQGHMAGYRVRNRFYEIGTPSSLEEFKSYIHQRVVTPRPTIFLDRDGTLNEIVFNEDIEALDSPLSPEQLKLLPGTMDALKIFKSLNYNLIIVTNQPAAAKGKASLSKLYEVNNRLRDLCMEQGVALDEVLMCAHFPQTKDETRETFLIEDCQCRKPKPGLITRAMNKFNIDIGNSYMVGDSHVDVIAGAAAGLKTVFLGKYKCDACQLMGEHKPTYGYKSLYEFSQYLKSIH